MANHFKVPYWLNEFYRDEFKQAFSNTKLYYFNYQVNNKIYLKLILFN